MPPREIPGYYWDAEKERFFKIEHSKTAPPDAAWSSTSVKKRKAEDTALDAQLQRTLLSKDQIKRSRVLNNPLMGGFLAREHGEKRVPDLVAAGLAQGIVRRGWVAVEFAPSANLKHMCIVSKNAGRRDCTVYGSIDERIIASGTILRDQKTSIIHHNLGLPPRSFPLPAGREFSDIKYSEKFNCLLASYRSVPNQCPPVSKFDPTTMNVVFSVQGPRLSTGKWGSYMANTIGVPPSSSEYIYMLGTSRGLAHCDSNENIHMYTPVDRHGRFFLPYSFHDVFAVDFPSMNPDIMYFGGRPGWLFTGDTREEVNKWNGIKLRNPITHIKPVGEHQVLVAGLGDTLSVFDLRYSPTYKTYRNFEIIRDSNPVVSMEGYKNAAHINIGLDYAKDSGLVAAAHDDGKVMLYSVRSGRRLSSQHIDAISSQDGPIQCLQFQTLVDDIHPSLFVGDNGFVNIYSLGESNPDEEA